jgi:hypothetical protein
MADVDIDIKPGTNIQQLFPSSIAASRLQDDKLQKHPVGVYLQNIPTDPITHLAAIPYNNTEEYGYFKIDFLNLNLLDFFNSKEEIRELINTEPNWSLLQDPDVVSKLFQLSKHYNIIQLMKPKSIEDLADCIAIIRPTKKHLLDEYIKDKYLVRKNKLYVKQHASDYRKAHAIAYATNIVLQLHLIEKQKL